MEVILLLINYNNSNEVISFVDTQLALQKNAAYKVVIVNNGDQKIQPSDIKNITHDKVWIINPEKNLGYLNGAHYAYEYFIEHTKSNPELIILCNTDIEFCSEYFIQNLLTFKKNNVGIIGPEIKSSLTGHFQNPIYEKRPDRTRLKIWMLFFSTYLTYLLYQSGAYLKRIIGNSLTSKPTEDEREVYAVHGSFIIFTKEFFANNCTLKYPSFLYCEELYLAEQCRIKNLKVVFLPAQKIIHHEHSTSGIFKNRKHVSWLYESVRFIVQTYFT